MNKNLPTVRKEVLDFLADILAEQIIEETDKENGANNNIRKSGATPYGGGNRLVDAKQRRPFSERTKAGSNTAEPVCY